MVKVFVEIAGFKEIQRKLRDPEKQLLAEPWSEAEEAIGTLGEQLAIRSAPLGPTGRTIAQMYHRVQNRPLPLWVRVGTHAKAKSKAYPSGFAYPRRLNFEPRSRHKGWFDRAIEQTKQLSQSILDKAARKIEKKWSE